MLWRDCLSFVDSPVNDETSRGLLPYDLGTVQYQVQYFVLVSYPARRASHFTVNPPTPLTGLETQSMLVRLGTRCREMSATVGRSVYELAFTLKGS